MKDRTSWHPGTTPPEIRTDIRRNYSVHVSYYRSWKGKELALEEIQVGRRPIGYHPTLIPFMGVDPGHEHVLSVKLMGHFLISLGFWALYLQLQGPLRRVIYVDGTHPTGKYFSTLLLA